jgi:glycosyltransferase involved in cell wall biosynthesis
MIRIDRRGLVAPAAVLDVDVERGSSRLVTGEGPGVYRTAFCLVRREGLPVGISFWSSTGDDGIDAEQILKELETSTTPEPAVDGGTWVGTSFPAVSVTVAICTRERPDDLRRALASLRAQSDAAFDVLVVDNAPRTDTTRQVVDEAELTSSEYVMEQAPGLARARNRGLRSVRTDVVAWFDDDEVADQDWVRRVKEGFAHPSSPAAVSGLMLPAQLETEAQVRFEQYGGFNKGRGTGVEVLKAGIPSVRNPLYPLPGFGAGGNMAFRTDALHRIGGFDQYLGAGTKTHGGEETLAFSLLLQRGEVVLHWPPAITWHYHRRDMEALERQLFGYSAGLSAFYASLIRSRPSIALEIMKAVPLGLRDALPQKDSQRSGQLPDDFPRHILRAARRGFAEGAFLYVGDWTR